MKAILAILLLVLSTTVHAAKDVVIQNKDGGEITFSFLKGSCETGMLLAYATSKSGEVVIRGCWFYDSDNERAFIKWQDGTVYKYE